LIDESINQNNYDSFFANFYQICQQFGVTLKVVRHIQKV
jgi:anthranilate/para-aminobenzoate synthase component II